MDWEPSEIQRRIALHRMADVTLTLTYDNKPMPNAQVTVRQERHKFLFGCNAYVLGGCENAEAEQAYRRRFADLLNYATLPFYWGSYEPAEGQPQVERLTPMAQWCRANQVRAKGHPLCWHEVVPAWLAEKPSDQVEILQAERIKREVSRFAGLIDTWDVINETVATPDFKRGQAPNPIVELCKRTGQVGLIAKVFDIARAANPKATLVLNDYDTSDKCEKLIAQCLAAGVPFDALGIQSHMHMGYWGPEKTWDVCRRFGQFGKPLHFTETTLLSGAPKTDSDWMGHHPGWDSTPEGEARQVREVEEFYSLLFSHPAVEAITWWDFSDYRAWQGAPSGLVRKDMTPKPAYSALTRLVKGQWWTGPLTLTTDARGQVQFKGFLGAYELELPRGKEPLELSRPGAAQITVKA